MAMKTKKPATERLVLSELPEEKRRAIIEEAVQWGLTVWKIQPSDLRHLWTDAQAREIIMYIRRDEHGMLVGVVSLRYFDVRYEGKDIVVIRLVLGASPGQRGNKFATRCLVHELIRFRLKHPLTPWYLFSSLIHPVTYKLCCDLLKNNFYPYFENTDNPPMARMLTYLADLFGVEKGDSPLPFVRRETGVVIETEEARNYWRNNQRSVVRFYVEHCPRYYNSSDCVIGVARLTLPHMFLQMLCTLARSRFDKLLGRKAKFIEAAHPMPLVHALSAGQQDQSRL
jgi:hypothetical protein